MKRTLILLALLLPGCGTDLGRAVSRVDQICNPLGDPLLQEYVDAAFAALDLLKDAGAPRPAAIRLAASGIMASCEYTACGEYCVECPAMATQLLECANAMVTAVYGP